MLTIGRLLLLGGVVGNIFAVGIKDIEKFFNAQGSLIAEVGPYLYSCDRGLPSFRVDFPVSIYRGEYVKNPLTGKKTFVILSQTGQGVVVQSFKSNSIIRITEDNGVKVGDIARLNYRKICFKGSDYAFSKLQNALPVVKTDNIAACNWAVEETPQGYRILFRGKEVFFTPKGKEEAVESIPIKRVSLRQLNLFVKAIELKSFNDIPVGVDSVSVSKGVNFIAVGFDGDIKLYQIVGNSLTPLGDLPTPNGKLVGIRMVSVGGTVYILGNALTPDAQPVSFVAKLVGTNPVVVKSDIPYLFGVLRKGDKPLVVVQKFDGSFGETYRFDLEHLKVGEKLKTPEGFRADTAILSSDGKLVFIDNGGILRIFEGSFKGGFKHVVDIEGNFGKSYTAVGVPSPVGDTSLRKVFFPPHPVEVQLFGFKGFLVAENESEQIVPLLGGKLLKFRGGKLVFVAQTERGLYEKKTLRGFVFEDALQGIAVDGNGTPFAVSGYKNPFLFQKGGKIYRLEFRYF
ncbi:MAG TPA: hypothetical protein EYO62_01835 [Aquificales bacterium]|nr:hypothetical protein [Aquificales bacterium]